jgi:hypothetical protein
MAMFVQEYQEGLITMKQLTKFTHPRRSAFLGVTDVCVIVYFSLMDACSDLLSGFDVAYQWHHCGQTYLSLRRK